MDSEKIGNRVFKVGDNEYEIVLPDGAIAEKASLMYRAAYATALRQGCMTRLEVDKYIKNNDVWNDMDTAEVAKMSRELQEKEDKLKDNITSKEDKMKIAGEMSELRSKIMIKTSQRNRLYNDTAEAYAEERRTEYYTVMCVKDKKTGKNIFGNLDDYRNKINDQLSQECLLQTILFVNGVDPDFLSKYPESVFLMENGLIEFDKRLPNKEEKGVAPQEAAT